MPKKQVVRNDETPQAFNFVHVTHPEETRNANVRRGVRSHITTRQHRLSRLEKSRKNKDALESSQASDVDKHDDDEVDQTTSSIVASRSTDMIESLLSPQKIILSHPLASKTSRTKLLDDPNDSIAHMLSRLRLNFSSVMDHYNWIVATQAVDFQQQFMPSAAPGTGFEILIPVISQDPALLATAILIAVGHILAIRSAPMSQNTQRCIFELRAFVIRQINAAIQDARRATSIPLIVAILLVATHEGLQGSVENYHIHMQGLVKMINLRGGLTKLNEAKEWFREYLVWQDTNVATILRCKPYHLSVEGADDAPSCKPNMRMWLLLDAVRD